MGNAQTGQAGMGYSWRKQVVVDMVVLLARTHSFWGSNFGKIYKPFLAYNLQTMQNVEELKMEQIRRDTKWFYCRLYGSSSGSWYGCGGGCWG